MTGNATFGVAFSSVENVYLYTTITQSNFNLGGLLGNSFVGGGQRLTLNGKLGTEYKSASIFLLEPWFLDRKLQLGNEVYYTDSTYMSDYYRQKNYGYALSLRRGIGDLHSVRFEYRIERFNLTRRATRPSSSRSSAATTTAAASSSPTSTIPAMPSSRPARAATLSCAASERPRQHRADIRHGRQRLLLLQLVLGFHLQRHPGRRDHQGRQGR